jgi:hypothetical protein
MPSRRKSPRKSSGVRPDYYRNEDAQDSPNLPSRKAVKPTPSKYKHKIGYKERIRKSPPERKKSTNTSPSESSYEEESESEEEDVIDDPRKKKSTNMISNRWERGRQEGRTKNDGNDDEIEDEKNASSRKLSATKVSERARREERTNDDDVDEDDIENETNSPEVEVSNIRRRIWERENDRNDIDDIDDDSAHGVSRHNENKRKRDDDDDYDEQGGSQINEMMKKDGEITKLKRTIKTLESKIKDMQRTSMGTPSRDKTGWKGEEFVFVKEVNDFCRDRLYPKEKFLRKNWKDYLPDDTRSLYSVSMKHLSIPEGSDKRDIWERVIVPSIRDKYQSMRCNMNNKIKSIYLSMRNLLVYANTYPTY